MADEEEKDELNADNEDEQPVKNDDKEGAENGEKNENDAEKIEDNENDKKDDINEGEEEIADRDQNAIDEDDEDTFSLISGEGTEEQEEKYQEYLNLLKEIKAQNEVIVNYKKEIKELSAKQIPFNCKTTEMALLKECLNIERDHLESLAVKAMRLQNFGSRRRYRCIHLEPMPEEE